MKIESQLLFKSCYVLFFLKILLADQLTHFTTERRGLPKFLLLVKG